MQLCALLSQLHRHQEALYHGQIAVRISHFLMRDLKCFIKSLVYREHYAKLEKIAKMKQASGKELDANNSKLTSSRIELKSNHSIESLKRSLKNGRESARENDTKIKKGDGVFHENDTFIANEEQESIDSMESEIETMSILIKGYKKIYPLVEFIEKYIIRECSDEEEGINGEPIKINHESDSEFENSKQHSESKVKNKGKSPIQASKLKINKIESMVNRKQRKFIKMQLNEAVKEEGVNAENLLGFINQK